MSVILIVFLPANFLRGLIWISLPEGDQIRRTFKNLVPEDIPLGDDFHAERFPRLLCSEVPCDVVTKAAVIRDCGGAVVHVQSGGSGFDFQLLVPDCRYIHRQHHVGTLKALPDGALEICRPAVFTEVS